MSREPAEVSSHWSQPKRVAIEGTVRRHAAAARVHLPDLQRRRRSRMARVYQRVVLVMGDVGDEGGGPDDGEDSQNDDHRELGVADAVGGAVGVGVEGCVVVAGGGWALEAEALAVELLEEDPAGAGLLGEGF